MTKQIAPLCFRSCLPFVLGVGALLWGGNTHAQVAYSTINTPGIVVTGVRADSRHSVVITASYTQQGLTSAGLYQGPLKDVLTAPASSWTFLTPVFPNQTVTSSTFYGPNTAYFDRSLGAGNIRAVGSYKYDEGASGAEYNHGMMYEGPIGSGTWTQLDATSLVSSGQLLNTIAHSTMGDLVVGNYDTSLATGKAFIYNVKTQEWVNLNPMGSQSVTAYGIWQNGGSWSHSYTITGGFSDIETGRLDEGYLVDYDSITGILSNFKSYKYKNQPIASVISHFDGITGTADGFNLTGDFVTLPDNEGGFMASVKRRKNGSFSDARWTEIAFENCCVSDATTTSGNTVVENHVLGIYVDDSVASSYVATVHETSIGGWLTWSLWYLYSILLCQ